MKPQNFFVRSWLMLMAPCLVLCAAAVQGVNAPVAAAPAGGTNGLAQAEVPKSTFIIPATIKEGRNPFFPGSNQPLPPPTPGPGPKPVIDAAFTLNGITSPPKRTAMINGRTFEVGESGEVKLPSGSKVLIKCEEIRTDSVSIIYEGQRRELRLRFGV